MKLKILLTINILFINFIYCQKISTSQAINITGKQCMLSQRIAAKKVYISGTQKSNQLKKSTTSYTVQFEQNLSMLNSISTTPKLREKIKRTEMLWTAYKKSILDPVDQSNTQLIDYSYIILSSCKKLQKDLYEIAEKEKEYPFNTGNTKFIEAYKATNNIKYLSQRLSFLYNIYYFEYAIYDNEKTTKLIKEINQYLSKIVKMKGRNTRLNEKIDNLEHEWKSLKSNLDLVLKNKSVSKNNSPDPVTISKGTNLLLKNADQLIREYKSYTVINN